MKKTTLALLVTLFVSSSYCLADSGSLETWRAGIENGKEIASLLNDQDFRGSLGKIASSASRFFSVLSPALSIVLAVVPSGESELERGFRELHNHLNVISDEIERVIEWSATKSAYQGSVFKIRNLKDTLEDIMSSRNSRIREGDLRKFRTQFESGINGHDAAKNLFEAMVGQDEFLVDNLADASVLFNKKHRRKVQKFLMGLANLVIKGAELEIAYETIKGNRAKAARDSGRWARRLQQMKDKMEAVDQQCESSWHEQSGEDLDGLLDNNPGLSNYAFKNKVYSHLNETFYWRTWFVAVYDEFCSHSWISSSAYAYDKQKNKQKASQSGGHERLCWGGRSTVVASSEPTGFDADWDRKGREELEAINRSLYLAWAGDWYRLLAEKISGYNFKFIGIICTDCHLSYTDFSRVITKRLESKPIQHTSCIGFGCLIGRKKGPPVEAILFY